MKKIIYLMTIFLVPVANAWGWDVEARIAGLVPQDKNLRSVYRSTMYVEYELESSIPLTWCDWSAWGNVSYYKKHGHSDADTVSVVDQSSLQDLDAATINALNNSKLPNDALEKSTEIYNWAFNIGLKYTFCCECCFQPYLGFGLGSAYVCFRDHSIYVKQEINQWGFSLLAKSGVEYELTCNLFLDLFADYSFNWFKRSDSKHRIGTQDINTGGFKAGLGIGYRF